MMPRYTEIYKGISLLRAASISLCSFTFVYPAVKQLSKTGISKWISFKSLRTRSCDLGADASLQGVSASPKLIIRTYIPKLIIDVFSKFARKQNWNKPTEGDEAVRLVLASSWAVCKCQEVLCYVACSPTCPIVGSNDNSINVCLVHIIWLHFDP